MGNNPIGIKCSRCKKPRAQCTCKKKRNEQVRRKGFDPRKHNPPSDK